MHGDRVSRRSTPVLAATTRGIIARLLLALFITVGTLALLVLVGVRTNAHAAVVIYEANVPSPGSNGPDPWGLAFDNNNNVLVAVPQCDPTPVCTSEHTGSIVEYSRQGFSSNSTPSQVFVEPAGYSSPVFLALDSSGNIWFSEPMTNSIGEFTPTTSKWSQWTAPTANAAPFDLTFDHHGNLWFTEVNANKIGEFNTTTHKFNETATPSAQSKPYGIAGPDPTSGDIWFTENNSSVARIGSFKPPASGALSQSSIKEYLTNSGSTSTTPHLITYDQTGDVWWTEGYDGDIGKLVIAQASPGTHNGVSEFAVPPPGCPAPPTTCGSHISGISVDSNGLVWFDDSLSSRIGSYNPGSNSFNIYVIDHGKGVASNTHPHDGLAVDNKNNVWFSEEFASKLGEAVQNGAPPPTPTPSSSPSPSASPTQSPTPKPTPSPTPNPGTVPVSKTWYFAEGKVGAGFTEYLTIENPDLVNDCPVTLQYLLGSGGPVTKFVTVTHATRFTESVNADLGRPASGSSFLTDSVIVTVTNSRCAGVVAERPMYFTNFAGVSSGSDVLGSTSTGNTFYFADVAGGGGFSSFITILNPGTTTANITATYVVGGKQSGTQTLQVPGGTRGTIIPNNSGSLHHTAVVVTSDQPVVVERPDYFSNVNEGNAQTVSGASSVVGVQNLKSDWLFAEGYTGGGFQEYLVLANFGSSSTSASVTLEFSNGHTETVPETIAAQDQTFVDVNAVIANHSGSCDTNPCQPTPDVSIEITSSSNIIAQREMFFHYDHTGSAEALAATGGSDVIGQPGPATAIAYSFAEGYTNAGYNEWLTLQNPTASIETINVTLVNGDGRSYSQAFTVAAHSRFTIDITGMVMLHLIQPGDTYLGYEVSLTVQSTSGPFVAERPIYWNTGASGTQGGSDVIGFV